MIVDMLVTVWEEIFIKQGAAVVTNPYTKKVTMLIIIKATIMTGRTYFI